MFTWILAIFLCSWKKETLVLKLKDQKLQIMQLYIFLNFKEAFFFVHLHKYAVKIQTSLHVY